MAKKHCNQRQSSNRCKQYDTADLLDHSQKLFKLHDLLDIEKNSSFFRAVILSDLKKSAKLKRTLNFFEEQLRTLKKIIFLS